MPDDTQDKPGVAGPITPPPTPPPPGSVMFSGISLALQIATVGALMFDRCDLGLMLGIGALIAGGVTFFILLRAAGDTQDSPKVRGPVPPPPPTPPPTTRP